MKKPNTIEHDLNRIRLEIYEETKDMTPEQRAERVNKIAEVSAKKFGFKFPCLPDVRKVEPLAR